MKKRGLAFAILSLALVATTSFSITIKNETSGGGSYNPATNQDVTITWKYDTGESPKVIETKTVDVPAYTKADELVRPTLPHTEFERDGHKYTFVRWEPAVSAAIPGEKNTYTATFKSDVLTYDITFDPNGGHWSDASEASKTVTTNYGAFPNPGENPVKDSCTFKGWEPKIEFAKEDKTYIAQYKENVTKYTINLECKNGCTVGGHEIVYKQDNSNSHQSFKFDLPSDYKVHGVPYKIDFKVGGESSTDYTYNESTATLEFDLTANTSIVAYADNSAVSFACDYPGDSKTIGFGYEGDVTVDWGDGTTNSSVSSPINGEMTHTYSSGTAQTYTVRVFGENINNFAFYKEDADVTPYGADNSIIKSVNLHHTITALPNNAFRGSNITNITFNRELESIGEHAFASCLGITSIKIPTGVTSLPGHLFEGCTNLENIELHNEITSIGEYAFSNTKVKSITIPSKVSEIANHLFYECASLSTVTLHDGITEIGKYSFMNCASLNGITIPSSVTLIDYAAFSDCTSLSEITIPSSVTNIGDFAFNACSNLKSLTLETEETAKVPELGSTVGKCNTFSGVHSDFKVYVVSVAIKEETEGKWIKNQINLTAEQIVAPAAIEVKSEYSDTCHFKLKNDATPTTGETYENVLVQTSGKTYNLPTTIKIYNGTQELDSSKYVYSPTGNNPGRFKILDGSAITRNITIYAERMHTASFSVPSEYPGGTPDPQTVVYGQTISPVPKLDDYTTGGTKHKFVGWDPDATEPVKADTNFVAQWEDKNVYTVYWKNYNGDTLDTETYEAGKTPVYKGDEPTKPASAEYTYTFIGWDKERVPLTEDTTFIAQFEATKNKYNITFNPGVGEWVDYAEKTATVVLENLEYGTSADSIINDHLNPTTGGIATSIIKDGVEYTFRGWSPEVRAVDGVAEYTAQYAPKTEYLVTWNNWDGTPLCEPERYQKGVQPVYSGPDPLKMLTHVIEKGKDKYTQYHKMAWNYQWLKDDETTPIDQMNLPPVTADTTYTAYFDNDLSKETVHIKFVGTGYTIDGKSSFTDIFTYAESGEHSYIVDNELVYESVILKVYKENEYGQIVNEAEQNVDYSVDYTARKITFLHLYTSFRFECYNV